MEINISRKTIILLIAAIALVVGAAFVVPPLLGLFSAAAPTAEQKLTESFVHDFYAVDYKDKQAWMENLRPRVTDDGYVLLLGVILPELAPQFDQQKTVIAADKVAVEDRGLILEGVSQKNGAWQIRSVMVNLDPSVRFPGAPGQEFLQNVLIVKSAQEWQFESFLTDDIVASFVASATQTASPSK